MKFIIDTRSGDPIEDFSGGAPTIERGAEVELETAEDLARFLNTYGRAGILSPGQDSSPLSPGAKGAPDAWTIYFHDDYD